MKKYLVLLSVVLISYATKAQLTLGVDGGLSIPGRDYGSSAVTTYNSGGTINGYAKIGAGFDAFVGLKFIPFIGVMAQYGVNDNAFDAGKFNNSGGTISVSGQDQIASYLIGPFVTIPLGPVKLEGKLLGGVVSSSYPTITESTSGSATYNSVVNSFNTGHDFGYCAGVKLKFMPAKIFGIALGVDYLASDATFKGTSTGYNTNFSQNYNMSVGIWQATLGLCLDF